MTKHVLYHQDSDGRFAGYCAWRWLSSIHPKEEVKLYEVQYGEKIPLDFAELDKECDEVYILDFSYSEPVLTELSKHVISLTVLDHHKSAKSELEGLEEKIKQISPHCAVDIQFDMSKSGALLAWEYFFPAAIPPKACLLVNDRDLWKFEFGDESRSFESYLRATGNGKKMTWWNDLLEGNISFEQIMAIGKTYFEYECIIVDKFTRSKCNQNIIELVCGDKVYKGVFYEGMGILHSEIAESFYNNEELNIDFTLEYRRKNENKVVFSLRSKKIDVSLVARTYGGGGHAAAAGFHMTDKDGYDYIARLHTQKDIWIMPLDLTQKPAE